MSFPRKHVRDEADAQIALKLIHDTMRDRGYPPSRREIAEACGWSSQSSAQRLVRQMESQGLIRTDPLIPRAVQITEAGMVALTERV
jgi:repressor LexA